MERGSQVYGITDVPFNGNAPIENEIILLYIFLLILAAASIYLLLRVKLLKKLRRYILTFIVLDFLFLLTSAAAAAFWMIPEPSVAAFSPQKNATEVSIKSPEIRISFDRPVDRTKLEKHLTPDSPGVWAFERSIPGTNLYQDLVFYPSTSLASDTEYLVTLLNISGYIDGSPKAFSYSFKTQSSPKISSVMPEKNATNVNPEEALSVTLDSRNDGLSEFDFEILPSHPIDIGYDSSSSRYILSPRIPFLQGTSYRLTVRKTNLAYRLPEDTIIERSDTKVEYEGQFTTAEAPGINSFTPNGRNILPSTPIKIAFTDLMDRESVEKSFSMNPQLFGAFAWEGNTMTFAPFDMRYETDYTVTIPKGTKAADGGYLPQDVIKTFSTIGSVAVTSVYPENEWTAVSIGAHIQVTFDQEVERQSAEAGFSIAPHVTGTFSWNGNTMVFVPLDAFDYSTNYTVRVASGIESVYGLPSKEDFVFSFSTQAETVKLDVPAYIQKYSLSCEIAALRMALAYKGVKLGEDALIKDVGFDNTPYSGGIWGDPQVAFVGNINGRQMVDGYGVHWGPIARTARLYRNAREFTGESTSGILKEVANGNPVIIWTYTKSGSPVSWNTVTGKLVNTVRGEHSVVVVGFVGRHDNPTHVIVNDPLVGQVYWDKSYFDERWNSLGRSGVVIY